MNYARFCRKPRRKNDVPGVVRHVLGGAGLERPAREVPGVTVLLHGPRGAPHREALKGLGRGEVPGVVRLARNAPDLEGTFPVRKAKPEEIIGSKQRLLQEGGQVGIFRQATPKEIGALKNGVPGVWRVRRRKKRARPLSEWSPQKKKH